jgi:hypothetical protein
LRCLFGIGTVTWAFCMIAQSCRLRSRFVAALSVRGFNLLVSISPSNAHHETTAVIFTIPQPHKAGQLIPALGRRAAAARAI